MRRTRSTRLGPIIAGVVLAIVVMAQCADTGDGDDAASDDTAGLADPGDCVPIDVAVSSEKVTLLTELANEFNDSDGAELPGDVCAFVRIQKKASGSAMSLLSQGWPDEDANGPRPVVWSPAASSWGGILNQRLSEGGEPPMATAAEPFMLTPLVIAMPEPMAGALGYPETPVGWADILRLAQDPNGWGSYGHPEWGPFRLGKTNPNFSTSALSATIAQYYAATGKTADLTLEDLERPEVESFAKGVESAVVHYGDITMTFLNNLFRNDARGTALTYVSAVAVEEKSILDQTAGTLGPDNPFIVLDAPWVDDTEREGARRFETFVQRPDAQRRVLEFGFRPGNVDVPLGAPIVAANGVDPDQPQTLLEVPEPEVLTRIIDKWAEHRKRARVTLLLDVSGSMGEGADPDSGETKLDLAKQAVVDSLDLFADDDDVGLRIFSTGLGPDESADWLELLPVAPMAGQREEMARRVGDLFPTNGTPLYTATADAYDAMLGAFDPTRINAVVLLTDGRNEDDRNDDLEALLRHLRAQAEGEEARPVRVFAIAYGADADLETLRRIAEATNAQVYDASDPTSISSVFTSVVSNF